MPRNGHSDRLHQLVDRLPLMPLAPGDPVLGISALLAPESLEQLFAPLQISDRRSAVLCAAGLWLGFNHLDHCHRIAQSHESPDGNYWHAIMHRREGDFSNSKYWHRNVGNHPIAANLLAEATRLQFQTRCHDAHALVKRRGWDPYLFVDLCERAIQERGVTEEFCRQTQQAEWHLLFEHCRRQAIAE